jgi:type IV pilus assembly protein PilN
MISINLLPVKASRRADQVKRELMLAGLGLGALVLACTGLYVVVSAEVSELKAGNAQLQKEIDTLKTIVARVDEIDELKQDLTKKLDVIAGLKVKKQGPVRMLDELSDATPEKLTLMTLREKDKRVDVTGVAVSNEVISQFLSNLERSDWFKDVYLVGIDQVEEDGYKLKEFQVTAKAVVPRAARLKAAETKPPPEEEG